MYLYGANVLDTKVSIRFKGIFKIQMYLLKKKTYFRYKRIYQIQMYL